MSRAHCYTCRRAKSVCLCRQLREQQTDTDIVILSHLREAQRKTASGYLAHLSLPESLYLTGLHFEQCSKVQTLLSDPGRDIALLFPKEDAQPISQWYGEVGEKQKTLIAIESTWAQANNLLARSPSLAALPSVTLDKPRTSTFRIRRQPRAHCLSTMEALAYAMQDAEGWDEQRVQEFLKPFHHMVESQMTFQIDHHPDHRRQWEELVRY